MTLPPEGYAAFSKYLESVENHTYVQPRISVPNNIVESNGNAETTASREPKLG